MSNDVTRINLAAALSMVTGIVGYPRRPTAFKPGDAWPQWAGSAPGGNRWFEETWHVLIILPQQEASADVFADQHQANLITYLSPIIHIDTIAPANIPANGSDLLGLVITGRTE